MNESIAALAVAVDTEAPREGRARKAAELIAATRAYRWVGIYDVGDEEIALIAHTGLMPAQDPRFGVESGLSGEVVRTRSTVVCKSEVIVPILGAESGIVIGMVDVESDSAGASSDDDVSFLEDCAAVLRPLYD